MGTADVKHTTAVFGAVVLLIGVGVAWWYRRWVRRFDDQEEMQ